MASHADQLILVDELRRAERQATLARLARAFAHLIGTPLNVISGRAGLIRAAASDEATLENARRIELQVERLAERIRRLIDHLTFQEPDAKLADLSSVVEQALDLYRPLALARGVELVHSGTETESRQIERTATLLVLTNLLSMSLFVVPAGARVELSQHGEGSNRVVFELSVPGFQPPTFRIDSLEPPERSDSTGPYNQVLTLCYAIAEQGGGKLEVLPERLRFTSPVS